MWTYRLLFILLAIVLSASIGSCQFLKPSPDATALKAVKAALDGKPGWQLEDLSISIENLHCKVGGTLGSGVIAQQLSDELKKLVEQGVIKSFENNCQIMDVTNPIMQDFTVPSLAF